MCLAFSATALCAPSLVDRSTLNLNLKAPEENVLKLSPEVSIRPERDSPTSKLSVKPPGTGKATATSGLWNQKWVYYIANITIGNQQIPLQIDTGSADTWFIQDQLTCMKEDPWTGLPKNAPVRS